MSTPVPPSVSPTAALASLAALSLEGLDGLSALCTVLRQARESPDFLRNPELLDHALLAMALVADNTAALVAQQALDAGVALPDLSDAQAAALVFAGVRAVFLFQDILIGNQACQSVLIVDDR